MIKSFKNEKGTILVAVLILLALATIVSVGFLTLSNSGTKMVSSLFKKDIASECTESALNIAALNLKNMITHDSSFVLHTVSSGDQAAYLEDKTSLSRGFDNISEKCNVVLESIDQPQETLPIYRFQIKASSTGGTAGRTIRATITTISQSILKYAWLSDFPIILAADYHNLKNNDNITKYIKGAVHSNQYIMTGAQENSYLKFYYEGDYALDFPDPKPMVTSVGPMMQFFKIYNTGDFKMDYYFMDTLDKNAAAMYAEYYHPPSGPDHSYHRQWKYYPDTTFYPDFVIPEGSTSEYCSSDLNAAKPCFKLAMSGNPLETGLGYFGRKIDVMNSEFKGYFETGVDSIIPTVYKKFDDEGIDRTERIQPPDPSDNDFLKANKLAYKSDCVIIDGVAQDKDGNPLPSGNICYQLANNPLVIKPKVENEFYYAPAGQMVNTTEVDVKALTKDYGDISSLYIGFTDPTSGNIKYPSPDLNPDNTLGGAWTEHLYNPICMDESGNAGCQASDPTGSMDIVVFKGDFPKTKDASGNWLPTLRLATNTPAFIHGGFNMEGTRGIVLSADSVGRLTDDFDDSTWTPTPDPLTGAVTGPAAEITPTVAQYYKVFLDTSMILPSVEKIANSSYDAKWYGGQYNFYKSRFFPPRRNGQKIDGWLARTHKNLKAQGIVAHYYIDLFGNNKDYPEEFKSGAPGVQILSVEEIQ